MCGALVLLEPPLDISPWFVRSRDPSVIRSSVCGWRLPLDRSLERFPWFVRSRDPSNIRSSMYGSFVSLDSFLERFPSWSILLAVVILLRPAARHVFVHDFRVVPRFLFESVYVSMRMLVRHGVSPSLEEMPTLGGALRWT